MSFHLSASIVPRDDDADIAGYAAGKIDDLVFDAIAAGLQVVGPELKNLEWNAGERLFPAWLLLIDGAATVCAQGIREAVDLNLLQAIADCPLDDARGQLDLFILREARRFAQLLDQCAFFRVRRSHPPKALLGLFRFLDGGPLPEFLRTWYQVVDFPGHGSSLSFEKSPSLLMEATVTPRSLVLIQIKLRLSEGRTVRRNG